MKTVTSTEFKNRAASILKEVSKTGRSVLVTKRGTPIARVEPIVTQKAKTIKLGAMAGSMKILGDIVSPVFDEWETVDPNEDPRRK